MRRYAAMLIVTLSFALTMAACSGGSDACDGFSCDEGSSCLIQDGEPTCVPDGNGGGGGNGQVGDECDDDNDCADPLTCQADLNGNEVCMEP